MLLYYVELPLPKHGVVVEPLARVAQTRGVELEPLRATLRLAAQNAGALQHPQVLGDGRLADRHAARRFADRGGAVGEAGDDLATHGVRESEEKRVQVFVNH